MKGQGASLSAEAIAGAKARAGYAHGDPHHEHDDCIRLAYEWLDAQKVLKQPLKRPRALKHIIEKWAGRYVSQSDVEVAAELHPYIFGEYPYFNVSARLVEPSVDRLVGIAEAYKHNYRERFDPGVYAVREE